MNTWKNESRAEFKKYSAKTRQEILPKKYFK